MLIRNRTQYVLAAALFASLAVVGCKKKEEPVAVTPAPAPAEPAPMPAEPAPMPTPAAVTVSSVTLGTAAGADKKIATPTDDLQAVRQDHRFGRHRRHREQCRSRREARLPGRPDCRRAEADAQYHRHGNDQYRIRQHQAVAGRQVQGRSNGERNARADQRIRGQVTRSLLQRRQPRARPNAAPFFVPVAPADIGFVASQAFIASETSHPRNTSALPGGRNG